MKNLWLIMRKNKGWLVLPLFFVCNRLILFEIFLCWLGAINLYPSNLSSIEKFSLSNLHVSLAAPFFWKIKHVLLQNSFDFSGRKKISWRPDATKDLFYNSYL